MKILQLIYESLGNPFGFGGAGARAYALYGRLKERHDITLLCMKYRAAKNGDIEGLKHIFVGTESGSLTRSVLAYTLRTADFLRRRGHEFDVIVENFLPATPFFAKLLTDTPVILQIQGIMENHAFKKFNPFYFVPMHLVERFYPFLYDRFVFVSEVTREKMMARCSKQQFSQVIPNGIDKDLLDTTPTDGNYVLFLSRIDIYTKGLDILVDAFARLSADYPDLRLVLAGYEFNRFSELLSRCPPSVKDRIEFAGFVTGDKKVALLSGAKLFVLPSRHESLPISILEAAACRKPVIVSDIPELNFVYREGFGLTFSSGSAQDLSERIRELLDDGQKRETLGERGRQFASQLLWDNIALQFENMLKHTVRNYRGEGSPNS